MTTRADARGTQSNAARWRIVALLMGFAALGHFNRVSIAVAGSEVFIPVLGVDETRMGWVYTAFLIVYTIGMLPGGWLIDRFGALRTLTGYGVFMGAFVVLTGTLGWFLVAPASLWLGLLVIRSLAGGCSAPLHPGAAHVVSDVMPERSRASANGVITAGAVVGIAGSYPVFGWLMDRLSWPLAFIVGGAALMIYALLWRSVAAPALREMKPAATGAEEKVDRSIFRALLNQRNLWLLTLSYAAFGYFQYLFFYWVGYYFEHTLNLSTGDARNAAFYVLLAQGVGMAIGGLSCDAVCRFLGTTWGRRAIVLTGMGLSALFALIGVNIEGQWNVTVILAISMMAFGMCEGVFWTTATDIGGKCRGFSGAFMNTGGNIGGFISPVMTPILAKQLGWPGAITVACIISCAGALIWFAIRPPGNPSSYCASG